MWHEEEADEACDEVRARLCVGSLRAATSSGEFIFIVVNESGT
ncbi:MAG TPA: hypothetical protein VI893_03395 [Thermoplasmata archaeon]|nr:hypothetical protein [Thermoplasmata archaeon]